MIIDGREVKGTIYFDTSKKGEGIQGIKRHSAWRADVDYDGHRYRKRSIDKRDCELFLLRMANEYEEKQRQRALLAESATFKLVP